MIKTGLTALLLGSVGWVGAAFGQSPPIDYPLNVFQCAPGKFVYGFNPVTAGLPGWFCEEPLKIVGPSNGLGLTASGTNQGTAFQLVNTHNQVTTVGGGTGVRLPIPIPYSINLTTVSNAQGVNDLFVYPTSGVQINGLGANNPITIPVGEQFIFVAYSNTQWYSTGPGAGGSGGGTVTSVGLDLPSSVFTVTGSPVTGAGTLTGSFVPQNGNLVFASPDGVSGVPEFRAMVSGDLPASGVTPGSYTNATITVDAHGSVTAATNGSGGAGTVTSVGLSVPAASIFGATGSPVTTSGTLGLTVTGVRGGIPYFDTTSTLSSSGLLTNHELMIGGGVGASPATLGSLGTTTTVLHGNPAGNPTFGAVANADLVNSSTTVNGQTCTLGSTCTITATAGTVTVGATLIDGGANGRILYDNSGVLGELATMGAGSVVLATSPTISGLTVTGSFTATGLVTLPDVATQAANTVVANVSGSTASPTAASLPSCVDSGGNHLNYTNGSGFSCGTSSGAASLTVGSTVIGSGTSGRILYDNAGVLGEATVTGSLGNVVLSTSPSISGLTVTGSFTATGLVTNADLANSTITLGSSTLTLGSTTTTINGVTWGTSNLITYNVQIGTTYTLASTDCGGTVVVTNGSAITVTLPNSLSVGCVIVVEQGGAGQITFSAASGAALRSAHSYTKTFNAAGAQVSLSVYQNSGGSSAQYTLEGDGA